MAGQRETGCEDMRWMEGSFGITGCCCRDAACLELFVEM